MNPPPPPKRTPLMFLKVAGSTIAVAVGLVYLIGMMAGKKGPEAFDQREDAPPVAANADCAASAKIAQTVKDLAKGDVAAMAISKTPEKLADFAFNDAEGKEKRLSAFAGKTLVFNLWASWCVPCREEMPALDRLQGEKGSDKFQVVTVNVDTAKPEKAKAFLDETGVKNLAYYAGPDLFFQLKQTGKALGLPITLLIGPDGCAAGLMNGPAMWDAADAKALVDGAVGAAQ